MKNSILLIAALLAALPAFAEEQFVKRWSNYDEHIMIDGYFERYYRQRKEIDFTSLRKYEGGIAQPPSVAGRIEAAFLLYSRKSMTVLLVTPENTMEHAGMLDDEYRRTMAECREDRSWIVVLPANTWTEIELNPYCTMMYGEDQIRIILYQSVASFRPLIEIVTSGLTCEPHYLYEWDRRSRGYELRSRKCTGRRLMESYWGGGIHYELLYR